MKINELFKTTYDWKFEGKNGYICANFYTSSGIRYQVSFSGVYCISIQFNLIGENGATQSITGTGDAFKVFSTIKDIILTFVKDKTPNTLVFCAKKNQKSRVKLYRKMADELSKILSAYKLEVDDESSKDEVSFTLQNPLGSKLELTENGLVIIDTSR